MSNRRTFIKQLGAIAGLAAVGKPDAASASRLQVSQEQFGVLVDATRCVGCRSCEQACNEVNEDLPRRAADAFKDEGVFESRRRMDYRAYTVVNRYPNPAAPSRPVYAKFQCMHCRYAACVSACIVGAFSRDATGAVIYDAWKCIGCRYCMAACPFQVPAYEYSDSFTPEVRKCTLCFGTRLSKGRIPACVESCPMEVMTFGKRSELVSMARARIEKYPGRYIDHIYGENEVGGTAWLYLSGVPFDKIDLPRLGYHPAPGYTEPIQHGIFKWFLPPAALYAVLGGIWYWLAGRKKAKAKREL
ncbi:4Fe-4S dicluster domain-containing protein [Thermodesulfobacteriota bacterium]